MKRRQFIAIGSVAVAGVGGCSGGVATSTPTGQTADVVLEPLVAEIPSYPLGYVSVRDGDVQLIPEKSGRIHVHENGSLNDEPLLDLRNQLAEVESWEQGLVGFTVNPSFETNGHIYVRYSAPSRDRMSEDYSHTAALCEFEVPSDFSQIDPESGRTVMEIPEPGPVHNGGALAFGPDGYLYIGVGDGGGGQFDSGPGHADDWYDEIPGGNGQDVTENLLGGILRIDVDNHDGEQAYGIPSDNPLVGADGLNEYYAWGLRNPYSMAWTDGSLIAGDVGQDNFEEVNVIEKGGNYGWNVREGQSCLRPPSDEETPESCPETTGDEAQLIGPATGYAHRDTESRTTSVVAGYMYTGTSLPSLEGQYVFGDLFRNDRGHIFAADPTETEDDLWSMEELSVTTTDGSRLSDAVIAFSEDQQGELYVSTYDFQEQTGSVYELASPD